MTQWIKIEKAELDAIQSTLAQALEALLFSNPTAKGAQHVKWHREAIEAVQLTMTNLRRLA